MKIQRHSKDIIADVMVGGKLINKLFDEVDIDNVIFTQVIRLLKLKFPVNFWLLPLQFLSKTQTENIKFPNF